MSDIAQELKDLAHDSKKGWATETTALAILDALGSRAKAKTPGDKEAIKTQGEETSRKKELNKVTKELSNELFSSLPGFTKVKGLLSDFVGPMSSVTQSMGSFAPGLGQAALGITAVYLASTKLAEAMFNSVNVLGEMRQVGVTFADGIIGMRTAAHSAGVDFETFSKIINANSSVIATLGANGTATFATLSREVRDELIPQFGTLGMTAEGFAENIAGYLEIQRQSGLLTKMTDADMRTGAKRYLKELTLYSAVMGKSRDEIARGAAEQRKAATNFTGFLANLRTTDELKAKQISASMDSVLRAFQSAGAEDFGGVVMDMVAKGFSDTDFGIITQTMGDEVGSSMKNLAAMVEQGAGPDEINAAFLNLTDAAEKSGASINQLARFDPERFGSLVTSFEALRNINQKEIVERQKNALNMKGFEASSSAMNAATIRLGNAFDKIVTSILGTSGIENVIKALSVGIDGLAQGVEWVAKFLSTGWGQYLTPFIGVIASTIAAMLALNVTILAATTSMALFGKLAAVLKWSVFLPFEMLGAAVAAITSPFWLIAGAVVAAVAGIWYFRDELMDIGSAIWNWFKSIIPNWLSGDTGQTTETKINTIAQAGAPRPLTTPAFQGTAPVETAAQGIVEKQKMLVNQDPNTLGDEVAKKLDVLISATVDQTRRVTKEVKHARPPAIPSIHSVN